MKKNIITATASVLFLIGYHELNDLYSFRNKAEKATIEANNLHNKLHRLKKDNAQLHHYFNNRDCGDYYQPATVVIECDRLE